MTDHTHELRRYARKIAHPAGDVPAVMLAAADEIERLRAENAGLVDDMNLLRDNNTSLRAKIAEMEQQEPAGEVVHNGESAGLYDILEQGTLLYALPGAQPAPSVPDDILRDAARYRFLRAAKSIPISSKAARDPVVYDEAIDAAMLAAAPQQEGE